MRAESGTLSTQSKDGKRDYLGSSCVSFAVKIMRQRILVLQNFAQTIASQKTENSLVSIMKKDAALFVIRLLYVINMPKKHTVRALVLEKMFGVKKEVYDLHIANDHEYFANGILVHNCMDALRYLLNLANYYTTEGARPIDLTKSRSGTPYRDFIEDRKGEIYGDIDVDLFDS